MAERLILPEQPTGIGRFVPGIDADHVFLEVDDVKHSAELDLRAVSEFTSS